jgi:ABC-type polysaccharide/polyol phosphate transport system ATPase subunit
MTQIACNAVSKRFHLAAGRRLLSSHAMSWFHKSTGPSYFYALRDVSLSVSPGESLALVGRNGAGKSTLLGLLAGLSQPDAGSLTVNGRVAALLELGSGFHPDLTGIENLILNAALLGFTERQTHERFDSIVSFADIGDFIEQPLRTYSSGMVLRLAFSVAINLDPDILIVDEILGVGDTQFFNKCVERILELRHAGKTLICVSHSNEMLARLCDRAVWLDRGRVCTAGPVKRVLEAYADSASAPASVGGQRR